MTTNITLFLGTDGIVIGEWCEALPVDTDRTIDDGMATEAINSINRV